ATRDISSPGRLRSLPGWAWNAEARASSEKAGVISGDDCPGDDRHKAASERPGNGEPSESPSKSTTVAGRSRRLTGSLTTRFAGAPGERITSGAPTSSR